MTKAREIVKRIKQAARKQGLSFEHDREGGNHTIYSLDGLMIPVPRHNEITEPMARTIYRQCEPKLGKDWWR